MGTTSSGSSRSPSELYQTARTYAQDGLRVVALHHINDKAVCSCDRSTCETAGKHPVHSAWQTKATTDLNTIESWWNADPKWNVGIATGRQSGIFVLDIDGDAGYASLAELESSYDDLPATRTITTGSGGRHYYFAYPEDETVVIRNSASKIAAGLDIRGDGGQVVAPPSVSLKGEYVVLDDSPIADAPEWLIALIEAISAKKYDAVAVPEHEDDDESVIERKRAYGENGVAGVARDLMSLTPPGTHQALYNAGLRLGSLSAGMGVDLDEAIGQCVEACESNPHISSSMGEVERTLRDGARVGVDSPSALPESDTASPAEVDAWVGSLPHATQADALDALDEGDNAPKSSWWPTDLTPYIDGTYVEPVAEILPRSDGFGLFYAGKTHAMLGESESGKSWVALLSICQEINAGRACVYIDPEDSPMTAVMRLRMLGATDEALQKHFLYVRPEMAHNAGTDEDRKAWRWLLKQELTIAVIDGMNAILATYGLASDSNDDVTKFMNIVANPLAQKTGASVIIVDHVTKSSEGRGRFAIGAQAKLATLTGCSYVVDVKRVFAPGQDGELELRVGKDRPGAVRGCSEDARPSDRTQLTARVSVGSLSGGGRGSMRIRVLAPNVTPSEDYMAMLDKWSLHREIYEFVENHVEQGRAEGAAPYPSMTEIRAGVRGGNDAKSEAFRQLVDMGVLTNMSSNGRTVLADIGLTAPPWLSPSTFTRSPDEVQLSTGCGKSATDETTDELVREPSEDGRRTDDQFGCDTTGFKTPGRDGRARPSKSGETSPSSVSSAPLYGAAGRTDGRATEQRSGQNPQHKVESSFWDDIDPIEVE